MKKSLFFIGVMATVMSVACKKSNSDNPQPPAPSPAEGYWTGKYSVNGLTGSDNAAILVKPGGVMRYYELGAKTDTSALFSLSKVNGVWSLSGNTFQCTYKSGLKTVNVTLNMNAAKTQMSGTWGFDATVKGDMEMSK
jgi:hypothetical protein